MMPAERVFREQYQAEFLEGSGAVFRNIHECATGSFADPVPGQAYYGGLDLAKIEDFTALVIVNRACEVLYLDRFNRIDWSQQVDRVKVATDKFKHCQVWVDSTGAGEPIFENLRRAGINAQSYGFTTRTKGALIDQLALLFEQRRIVLPKAQLAPVLIDELEAYEFSISESGNVRMSAPPGSHDDTVISLGLATWIPGKFSTKEQPTHEIASALFKCLGRENPWPEIQKRPSFGLW